MKSLLATAIAIITGFIILSGYFLPIPILGQIQSELLSWAIILSAVAMLIGIINLFMSHLRKFVNRKNRDIYSFFLIAAFLATLIAGLVLSPGNSQFQHIVTSIQIPIETSLLALLAILLVYATIFITSRKKGVFNYTFVISIIIFLIIQFLMVNNSQSDIVQNLYKFFTKIPLSGARGILLGIAIGSLATGLRVLLGADRPYRG